MMLNRLRDWWAKRKMRSFGAINTERMKHWRNGRYSSCDDPECRVCR